MKREFQWRMVAVVVIIAAAGLIGACSYPAVPGSTYLAIDWVYAPEALSFPAFPSTVYAGEYIEHDAGYYTGEYIAWDGSYWRADYRIEIDEGEDGFLLTGADDGDDYYLTMWLYSTGPSICTDDIVYRSVRPVGDAEARVSSMEQAGADAQRLLEARVLAEETTPEIFESAVHSDGVTTKARSYRYDIGSSS